MKGKRKGAPAAISAGDKAKASAAFAKRVEDTIRRHYYGVLNPKGYLDRSISLRILTLLPPIIDSCLYDVETIGGVPYRDPKMLKLQREAATAVDRLLKYVRKDNEDTFRYLGAGDKEAARRADDLCDVSVFVNHMLQLICGFGSEAQDEWRLTELMKTAEAVLTEDAQKSKEEEARQYCLARLKAWGVDGVEEAAERGVKPCDLQLRVPLQEQAANPARMALRTI